MITDDMTSTETMKPCSRCKEAQPLSAYHKHKHTRDGRQSQCKTCARESTKESHGLKRAEISMLRSLMKTGMIEYQYAEARMKKRHERELAELADKYREQINGKAIIEAEARAEELGVCSPEPESFSDNG